MMYSVPLLTSYFKRAIKDATSIGNKMPIKPSTVVVNPESTGRLKNCTALNIWTCTVNVKLKITCEKLNILFVWSI